MAEKPEAPDGDNPAFLELMVGSNSSEGTGGGGSASSSSDKLVVIQKKTAPPWDPLSSPDWDRESHTKEALLRIKRCVACYLHV